MIAPYWLVGYARELHEQDVSFMDAGLRISSALKDKMMAIDIDAAVQAAFFVMAVDDDAGALRPLLQAWQGPA